MVCGILRNRGKNVTVTQRAQHEWQMAFLDAYSWDLFVALEDAIKDDAILGRLVPDIVPPGEAYEFFFTFKGKQMYGKVNLLTPERKAVIVISAHIPNKGDKL